MIQRLRIPRLWPRAWVGYLLYGIVAAREVLFYLGRPSFLACVALLALFLALFVTEPLLSRRLAWYNRIYFPLQTGLVCALGLLPPYFDMWAVLFCLLGLYAVQTLPRASATIWLCAFALIPMAMLTVTLGITSGLAAALSIVAGSGFFISYELLYQQTEARRAESQALLAQLQEAHQQLQTYAAQAEELAVAQERGRLAYHLHDSANQVIFGIALTARAARTVLDKSPERASEQIDRLQEMTGNALRDMRSLITELRPKP